MNKRFLFLIAGFAISVFVGCSGQLTNDFRISGEIQSGIIGGEDVASDTPVARHSMMLVDLETNQICSGSLVSRNVILTAAHCIPSKKEALSVFFGLDPLAEDSTSLPVTVREILLHPAYSRSTDLKSVDLALVFLVENAPEFYAPVILSEGVSFTDRTLVQLVGYGKSSLQEESSFGRLRQVQSEVLNANEIFFEVDQQSGKGICDGDSGGAAFVQGIEGLTLVGVTKMAYDKYAQGGHSCLGVSQFTRVDKNLPWILENL